MFVPTISSVSLLKLISSNLQNLDEFVFLDVFAWPSASNIGEIECMRSIITVPRMPPSNWDSGSAKYDDAVAVAVVDDDTDNEGEEAILVLRGAQLLLLALVIKFKQCFTASVFPDPDSPDTKIVWSVFWFNIFERAFEGIM